MSKISVKSVLLIGVVSVFSLPSYGQQLMVYKDGVSNDQSMRDQSECAMWATQNTGYNPAYGSSSGPDGTEGARVRGAARGAVVGAVVGGIAGDAGTGALAGAAGGMMVGGMRRREARRQQQNQQNEMQGNYNRALATCLQGRGYTVN